MDSASRTPFSSVVCCSARGDARARLEVDAEVQALGADRQRADQQDHAGEGEEPLRLAHEVERVEERCRRWACPSATPSADRCASRPCCPACPARPGWPDRGEQRDERADAQHEREPSHAGRRDHEQDERDHERHDVGVDDRRDALAVALGDARGDRPARAYLLLDALEDDDVRVGGDGQRQHEARDARERQRHRDQLDQREEVDAVDDQRADGDQAEHAVEDQQEQGDDDEADDARDEALVERLLAQRRGHL